MSLTYDIAVVGGGASGLVAGIQAKRLMPGARVVVLERQSRFGKKLMATGNGRCNLTNAAASLKDYHGGVGLMREAMRRHPPSDVIEFFRSIGVEPLYEGDKVYPLSEQASSVLDALRLSVEELGVESLCDFDVATVNVSPRGGFSLDSKDGRSVQTRKVIMATGSVSAPNLGGTDAGLQLMKKLGHTLIPQMPALVQLKTPVEPIKPLTGIKYEGGVSIWVDGRMRRAERGEVLFTNYGLSGPPVLQLSRIASEALAARKSVEVSMAILDESPIELLRKRRELLKNRTLEHFLTGMLNKRIGQTLLKLAGCVPLGRMANSLNDDDLYALAGLMTDWRLDVLGTQGFANAQVAAGGVQTKEFDADTLESKKVPGLYATGELLDIDGDCGGFNLQWAWASGMLAAESAVASMEGEGA